MNNKMDNKDKKIYKIIVNVFDTFHKFGLWFLVACALGIYIGVSVTRMYYTNKLKESIEIGAFMFNQKVYTIIQK